MMHDALAHIRQTQTFSLRQLQSSPFTADKADGRQGIAGLRVLHCFSAWAMAWFGGNRANTERERLIHFAQGGVPKRNRENAITAIACARWRSRDVGFSTITSNYDGRNALGCTRQEKLEETIVANSAPRDIEINIFALHNITIAPDTPQGSIRLKPRSGSTMGFSTAAEDFVRTYTPQIQVWNADLLHLSGAYAWSYADSIVTEKKVDISIATFVDDVTKLHPVVNGVGAEEIVDLINTATEKIGKEIEVTGHEFNKMKTNHLVDLAGPGAHTISIRLKEWSERCCNPTRLAWGGRTPDRRCRRG